MEIMELELKHIAPYLPYELKCEILDYKCDYVGDKYDTIKGHYLIGDGVYYNFKSGRDHAGKNTNNFKPILRPLTDLSKEFKFRDMLCNMSAIISCSKKETEGYLQDVKDNIFDTEDLKWWQFERLLQFHFDVFGLIPEGLAIDINTL